MDIPNELWSIILFQYTKYNMSSKHLLDLVSKDFHTINNTYIPQKWEEIMNISIEILATIAYFVDRKDEDFIDYLMGPILISNFSNDTITDILPKLSYCKDRCQSNRLLDSVILSNVKMGQQFGPNIHGIEISYNNMVKYYRNDTNSLVSNNFPNIDNSYTITDSYWLYIFEELCHYCKTYSYMILPYYNDAITNKNGSLLYTIYQLNIDKMLYIDDTYFYESDTYTDSPPFYPIIRD